jgi:hypothetical protein
MGTIINVILGGIITWFLAWYYYKRAGEELRHEAEKLRKLNSMILIALEKQGWVKLNRDKDGNITGFLFEYAGNIPLHLGISSHTEFDSGKKR